jgi:hypothetical protein
MSVLRVINSELVKLELSKFKDISDKVCCDLAFQANEFTRWSNEQRTAFITSFITNKAPSPLIFADIAACLENAIRNEQAADIEYYQRWKKIGDYMNLDGNNRVICIRDFINDKVSITPANYYLGGNFYRIIEGKNDTISTMPKAMLLRFQKSILNIVVYTDATREELSDLFGNVNEGSPLNNPEKRNARTSDIASMIRGLAKLSRPFFSHEDTKWFSASQVNRRGIDDFIASLCYVYFNGLEKSISTKSLMDMYRVGSNEDTYITTFESSFKNFLKIVQPYEDLRALTNRNLLLDLYYIMETAKKEGKEFKDKTHREKFLHDFIIASGELVNENKLHDMGKNSKPKTFDHMVGGQQMANNKKRNELLMEKLNFDNYYNEVSSTRSASALTRLGAAVRDNLKTPEGKSIDLSKLHDGKTYHAGHITPHADGADAGLSNIAIQEARDNLVLGRKPIEYKN